MFQTQDKLRDMGYGDTRYRRTLKSAAEEARLMASIGPVLESVPLRGTPEWDVRERARAVLGCKCLSFGAL